MPLAERSRIGCKLAEGRFLTTVEIVPPKGVDPAPMFEQARRLKAAGVDAVNVPDGPRAQSRMGALLSALMIQREVGLEAVVHYACRDRNLLGMLSDLLGAAGAGIRNLLIVTGDPPKMGPYPEATAVFDIDSIGLTNLVSRLNRGLDPGGNPIGQPTRFVIGVGVNPAAPDLEREIKRFAWKVEAGAEWAITQPVFDLVQLDRFLKRVESFRIPIVAGIWPLVSLRNAEFLANEVPGITVPNEVLERMRRASAKGKDEALAEGVRISQEMLIAVSDRVQGAQVSAPLGRVPVALEVLQAYTPVDLTPRPTWSAPHAGPSYRAIRPHDPVRRRSHVPGCGPRVRRDRREAARARDGRGGPIPAGADPKFFELGLMGIEVPEQYGGAGGGIFLSALAIEEIARVDASAAIYVDVHNTLVTNAVLRWGTAEQHQHYFPRLTSDLLGAFALSEPGSGSDAFALATRAEQRGPAGS